VTTKKKFFFCKICFCTEVE